MDHITSHGSSSVSTRRTSQKGRPGRDGIPPKVSPRGGAERARWSRKDHVAGAGTTSETDSIRIKCRFTLWQPPISDRAQ